MKLVYSKQLNHYKLPTIPTLKLRSIGTHSSGRRRVVVTGLGVVTPLGVGVKGVFERLVEGKGGVVQYEPRLSSQVKVVDEGEVVNVPSKVAGLVPRPGCNPYKFTEFRASEWVNVEGERLQSPFIQFALSATRQALEDAEWVNVTDKDKERTGVCFGSGIGSLLDSISTWNTLEKRGYSRVSPFYVPRILTNMAAGHISIQYGFQGPNHSVSTACTTGAHSIGDAFRFIQYGDAEVMVAGGSEASINALSMSGFARARSLSTKFNHSPLEASRPFDRDRDGFVIGEGAGAVVLEELCHAQNRGARIYAELKGYGLTGDAHHITSPPDSGLGAQRAMKRALETAGMSAAQIDYVNAHATSTGKGDAIENFAIKQVFPGRDSSLAVSSSKGSIGHLLGAAGAVEAIFTILALHQGILPPTLNLHNPGDPKSDFTFNYVPIHAQTPKIKPRAALTNSFGFGGTNASLCFTSFP